MVYVGVCICVYGGFICVVCVCASRQSQHLRARKRQNNHYMCVIVHVGVHIYGGQ